MALSLLLLAILASGSAIPGQAAPSPAPADGAFQLETIAGERLVVRPVRWAGDALVVRLANGSERRIEGRDWLLLRAATPPATPDRTVPADLLVLAGPEGDRARSDRLWGRLAGGDRFGVRFAVEGGPPFEVPFERIERLLPRVTRPVDRLVRLPGAGLDDRLWQALPDGGLDGLSGVVERVDADRLVIDSALGPLGFPLDELLAVVFGDSRTDVMAPAGLPIVLRLSGGTLLRAGLLELDEERLVVATGFAERLELPLAAVASLLVAGERAVPFADLVPVEVHEHPTVGGPDDFLFPWRRDLSVTGRVLSVDDLPRASGFGVHAHSRLVFDLPERAIAVAVGAGLSDEVASLPAEASVRFSVLVDGRPVVDGRALREGQPSLRLRVDDLTGARRLELVVDDGGDDDAGDRAAWFEGAVLLAKPAP